MRNFLIPVSALCFSLLPIGVIGVTARGESSYKPSKILVIPTRSSHVITKWSWESDIDTPPDNGNMVATGDGVATFATANHICGFSLTNGKRLWCATPGASPAYASGVVAFAETSGSIAGVEARSGTLKWRLPRFMQTEVPTSIDIFSFASENSENFLIFESSHGATQVAEVNAAGRLLWSSRSSGAITNRILAPPYVFQTTVESGATINSTLNITRLQAPTSIRRVTVNEVDDILDVSLPTAVVTGSWMPEDVDDRFLTFDVEKLVVSTGQVSERYHFEPDYSDNYKLYSANQLVGKPSKLRADSSSVYISLAGKLYRYELAAPNGQHPELLSSDATFLGGPVAGTVLVQENDGVHAIAPVPSGMRDTVITSSKVTIRNVAIEANQAFLGFEDGRLLAFDLLTHQITIDASLPCTPERFGASGKLISVVCQTRRGMWHLYQFKNPRR